MMTMVGLADLVRLAADDKLTEGTARACGYELQRISSDGDPTEDGEIDDGEEKSEEGTVLP